jgi:hypothetical protein
MFFTLPYDWITNPARFYSEVPAPLLPVIIAWPLAWIISIWNRGVRWWTLWALGFTIFWFLQVHQLRYWLPALALTVVALCASVQYVLEKIVRRQSVISSFWATVSLIVLLLSAVAIGRETKGRALPPVDPSMRRSFLSTLGGYNAVRFVNRNIDKGDSVCVISAGWLNYYFDVRVIDVKGSLFQDRVPTFKWPNDESWVRWLESENVEWIFLNHTAPELNVPKQNPMTRPFWPGYELVYADSLIWVFQHANSS